MSKTNVYDDKKLRYVDLQHPTEAAAKWLYYFKTNVDLTEVTDLGQTEVTALASSLVAGAIAGTRRPHPLVVHNKKKRITSLCSSSKFGTAQASGWRRRENAIFSTKRTQNTTPAVGQSGAVLVVCPVNSLGAEIAFGWFMQNQQFLKITDAERTALGIQIPTTDADWAKVVLGCNFVRPPRARKTTFEGQNNTVVGGSDTTETFYAVGSILPAGWTHSANMKEFTL